MFWSEITVVEVEVVHDITSASSTYNTTSTVTSLTITRTLYPTTFSTSSSKPIDTITAAPTSESTETPGAENKLLGLTGKSIYSHLDVLSLTGVERVELEE
jgi:hypothetical protein